MNKGKDQKEFDDVSLLDGEKEKELSAVALNVGLETVALFANKILVETGGRMADTLVDIMNECFEECDIPLLCSSSYEVIAIGQEGL